jgi:hypothetical protein
MNQNDNSQSVGKEAGDAAQPQPKCGCGGRIWMRIGLIVLLVLIAAAVVGYWQLIGRVHHLEVYKSAMAAIKADKEMQKKLGLPIHSVHWPPRAAVPNLRMEENEIDIRWAVHGPDGRGEAHVLAKPMQGKWELIVVEVDGKRVALAAAEGGAAEAPKFTAPKADAKKPEANLPPPDVNLTLPPDVGK